MRRECIVMQYKKCRARSVPACICEQQAPWSHGVETKARSKFTIRVFSGALILIGATLFFCISVCVYFISLLARGGNYLRELESEFVQCAEPIVSIKIPRRRKYTHCALLPQYLNQPQELIGRNECKRG
jgi:hypothetical protein